MDFDVVIVGSGPAGCSCALMLAQTGLNIAIVDKSVFPRDKTCGDALSGNTMYTLKRLPGNVYEKFINELSQKIPSYGVRFTAPNLNYIDIPFKKESVERFYVQQSAPGYICKRRDFDNFLYQQLNNYTNIKRFEDCRIEDVLINNDIVIAKSKEHEFKCKIIVGADGAQSVLRKKTFPDSKIKASAGLRAYYKNVTCFSDNNYIELYFFKDILPGYFWLFPLADNTANAGIGMLSEHISRKKLNLKSIMLDIIQNHPLIKERFANAVLIDDIKGHALPLGNRKRKISGKRFLLTGDAASLIDPFTGEGIGNAMLSGKIAAEQIEECFKRNDFSESFIGNYDKMLYDKIWNELKISRTMQNLTHYPFLFNLVINKANRNQNLNKMIVNMINNIDVKKELTKPSFYFKLLFD